MSEDKDCYKDFSELLEEYQDQESMHSFEGDMGLDKMNQMCAAIGYAGHDYKYGSNIEQFLSDNPGACEAIVEWIAERGAFVKEWREGLISCLDEPEEDSDED